MGCIPNPVQLKEAPAMRGMFHPLIALALSVCVSITSVAALDLRGPILAADTNFGQGWRPDLLRAGAEIGLTDIRDAVYWARTEQVPGRHGFTSPVTRFPDTVGRDGLRMSLVVNNGHPNYDGGVTPHSPAAVEAFAAHAAAMVARFPAIQSVEVGNEVNGDNFVSGPLRDADLPARADGYVALLAAVARAVRAQRPSVSIVGGGAHSISVGWLDHVDAAGGAAHMDALALHPYTTPPEQIAAQVDVLRRRTAWRDMPLEMTEFGTPDPVAAPGYLMRAYCAFALAGVSRAVWYPLHPRGDGLAPLITDAGAPTAVGRTFALLRARLEGQAVRDVAPDAFTRACAFDGAGLVLWGMEREVTLAPGLLALDSEGRLAGMSQVRLSENAPIFIVGEGRQPELGTTVRLAPHRVLADTFFQFDFPEAGLPTVPSAGFERFARRATGDVALVTRPGQERRATFWTPYRGGADDPMLRLTAEHLLPAAGPTEIVHRYTATSDWLVDVVLMLEPPARSRDGVTLSVMKNGTPLRQSVVTGRFRETLSGVPLAQGDVLEIAVGPGASPAGDLARYRFTLREAE